MPDPAPVTSAHALPGRTSPRFIRRECRAISCPVRMPGAVPVVSCAVQVIRRASAGRMSRLLVDRVCVVLIFHVYGSFASSSRILRGRSPQCLQHFISTEYMRAMQ